MRHFIFIMFCFSVISCDSSQANTQNSQQYTKNPEALPESQACIDITKLRNIDDTNALAKTNILDFKLTEGCICITYEYSGCNTGEPMIVWDGIATKSMRPTVHMNVHVKEAGMCDQLLKATTCFSMSEMESLGTQVLVYLNGTKKNFLINYQEDPLKTD